MKEWKGEQMDKTEVYPTEVKELKKEQMDKVEIFKEATIHHGKFNDRLYIMKFPEQGGIDLVDEITRKAMSSGYTKVIGKAPKKLLPVFLNSGYKVECTVPRFFKGEEDCCFVSRFLSVDRAIFDPEPLEKFNEVLDNYEPSEKKQQSVKEAKYDIRELNHGDAEEMTAIFKEVFSTYPFPVHNAGYIKQTMDEHICYYGVFIDGKLKSISSAEMDRENQNAEMTDFAVLPSARGLGLSKLLLHFMEDDMRKKNFKTLFTLARLHSIPMNKTFLGAGYSYAGTLINNTNIAGGIESMNILYKYI